MISSTEKKSKTLYFCYFGLREPLVQTQVLPYLREISKDNIKPFLLTFETDPETTWTPDQIREMQAKLASEGIAWHFLKYHKTPSVPATLFDIVAGAWFASKLNQKEKFDIFHGRVHLPTLMGWLAKTLSAHKPKLLFDVRGFFPEEYTDAGIWKENGLIYKTVKSVENLLRRKADGFVVLTEKARELWFPESKETGLDKFGRPVEVIPCCVDFNRFESGGSSASIEVRKKLQIGDRPVIVYVGSFGGFYMTQETADFFIEARRQHPNAFALILTQSSPQMIQPLLESGGYGRDDFFIQKVLPSEIPKYLSASDAALSFIKPCYSKLSSSPTKNAEYLACGLPIIANSGVGDVEEQIEANDVGYVIDNFNKESYLEALTKIDTLLSDRQTAARCRETARKLFDLGEIGGKNYRRIYERLIKTK